MNINSKLTTLALLLAAHSAAWAQEDTATVKGQRLEGVTVTSGSTTRRMAGAVNGTVITRQELFKAACCNLGESFVTNPSVDVNYSDATTGAKQIKLLGLSGTYVQMLTENMPAFRGAALPYALGYVPGTWMQSIQVSKGNASVKNGYEAITGQLNVEYLKPEAEQAIEANLYGNTKGKFEANADANVHLDSRLSTNLLLHFENNWGNHDKNGDGFIDMPKVRQYNLSNRWVWKGDRYIFHGGLSLINENRTSGQTPHHHDMDSELYRIGIRTNRYEGYMKHAFVLDPAHGGNLALMANTSMHEQSAFFGHKEYGVNEKNVYAQLMYETNFTPLHNLSTGVSVNYDYLGQRLNLGTDGTPLEGALAGLGTDYHRLNERETTPGAYAQYTLNLHERLVAMAGIRVDHSSLYGTFVTPRMHVKWMPNSVLSLRLSAGKGYRTVHPLAEMNYLLASGRTLQVDNLEQEAAWNYGVSTGLNIPLFGKTLKLNAEYYYTRFSHQAVIDYDTDPHVLHIANLQGKSYSNTFQVDATYPLLRTLSLTAAYRLNDVKTTYGGQLLEKPLQSKYKGLVSLSYKSPLELWKVDVTLQLNGGGRMPNAYTLADGTPSWESRFHAYEQLSAQITREFRHVSLYIGGENLTNYRQKHPIIGADNPWSNNFEPTLVWGPVEGAMGYIGMRIKI